MTVTLGPPMLFEVILSITLLKFKASSTTYTFGQMEIIPRLSDSSADGQGAVFISGNFQ
jgi:hypothetical protein